MVSQIVIDVVQIKAWNQNIITRLPRAVLQNWFWKCLLRSIIIISIALYYISLGLGNIDQNRNQNINNRDHRLVGRPTTSSSDKMIFEFILYITSGAHFNSFVLWFILITFHCSQSFFIHKYKVRTEDWIYIGKEKNGTKFTFTVQNSVTTVSLNWCPEIY